MNSFFLWKVVVTDCDAVECQRHHELQWLWSRPGSCVGISHRSTRFCFKFLRIIKNMMKYYLWLYDVWLRMTNINHNEYIKYIKIQKICRRCVRCVSLCRPLCNVDRIRQRLRRGHHVAGPQGHRELCRAMSLRETCETHVMYTCKTRCETRHVMWNEMWSLHDSTRLSHESHDAFEAKLQQEKHQTNQTNQTSASDCESDGRKVWFSKIFSSSLRKAQRHQSG